MRRAVVGDLLVDRCDGRRRDLNPPPFNSHTHTQPHRHLCPHGRNCSFLSHSVADKRVIRHTASFLHPCPWGARCVAARAPHWNWEHMQSFIHTPMGPLEGGMGMVRACLVCVGAVVFE
jgi:hypothetical protein